MRNQQRPDDPDQRAGQCRDDDQRVEPGLEVDDQQQVDEHDRAEDAEREAAVGGRHRRNLAAQPDFGPLRQVLGGRHVVVRDQGGGAAVADGGDIAQGLRAAVLGYHRQVADGFQ